MDYIAEEILREIFFLLSTMDVARCRCVSRQWRGLLINPTFIDLHVHALSVVSGGAEALLVSQTRALGMTTETTVYSLSSAKPMCSFADLADGYRPGNVCNGFLLMVPSATRNPVFVFNPITGDKLKIPAEPMIGSTYPDMYFMGFSLSTRQYKLFRLSYPAGMSASLKVCLEVYTLGEKGGGEWRRHPHILPWRTVHTCNMPPTVCVDGKLYAVTAPGPCSWPDRMLVIDVASETHSMYPLPVKFTTQQLKATVHPFEACGQLCVAVRIHGQLLLHFWVMQPLKLGRDDDNNHGKLDGSWELRHTFNVDEDIKSQVSIWLDGRNQMLRCKLGDFLYKYDMTKDKQRSSTEERDGGFKQWDQRIQVPAAPPPNDECLHDERRILYGGYRPSLLSPHHLEFKRNNDEQQHYKHALLHALRC